MASPSHSPASRRRSLARHCPPALDLMRENTPRTPLVTRAFTGADDRESRRMTLSLASSPAIEISAAFFTKFLSTTEQCVGLTPDGGHLTGGTAGPAGRMSVC